MTATRRIALGSGLHPDKLLETIRQLESGTALICDAPEVEHGWIHLRKDGAWLLQAGYPSLERPTHGVAGERGRAQLAAWEAGIYLTLVYPPDTEAETLAQAIMHLMLTVQGVAKPGSVRVALEFAHGNTGSEDTRGEWGSGDPADD